MEKQLFVIGNGAYTGANALAVLFSVEDAVDELCRRGVQPEEAREEIDEMVEKAESHVYLACAGVTGTPRGLCELSVYLSGHTPYGWPTYDGLKAQYGRKNEVSA